MTQNSGPVKFSSSQIRPRQRLLQLRQIHQPGLVALRLGPGGVRKPGAGKKHKMHHSGPGLTIGAFSTSSRMTACPTACSPHLRSPNNSAFSRPPPPHPLARQRPNDCPPFPKRQGLRAWAITHRRHHAREHPQSPDGPPHARLGGRGRDALHRVGCRGACGEW